MMKMRQTGSNAIFMATLFLTTPIEIAWAQKAKDQLVGTWALVSVISEADDGNKTEPFGSDPKGMIMFSSEGHFSLFQSKAEIPRIAANDRAKATPEEARAIVASAIAYYGTYSVSEADKTILVKVNASTFANVAGGAEQKRIITSLTADELKFTNPRTPASVTLRTTWKRAPP
jgi:hypothetical protein